MRAAGDAAPIVIVDDAHVIYRVFEDRRTDLRERVATRRLRRRSREVHALRGVSFVLYEGDSLGVVGTNGTGKSTLLSALAGLLPLESGRILARSQPTLLGVRAAMREQLSGRRNIALGCLAAGMSPDEVEVHMDEIIEFSGLAEFIDLPMRAYSSGMQARLWFSIATVQVPDILLIDEALAVGDEGFKQRSLARMAEIRAQAGAVVLVSHNSDEILDSCSRAIWLDRGVIRAEGTPEAVLDAYLPPQSLS